MLTSLQHSDAQDDIQDPILRHASKWFNLESTLQSAAVAALMTLHCPLGTRYSQRSRPRRRSLPIDDRARFYVLSPKLSAADWGTMSNEWIPKASKVARELKPEVYAAVHQLMEKG